MLGRRGSALFRVRVRYRENDRKRRHLEVEEATLSGLMRGQMINRQKKSAGAIVPYLRPISG
jgi:hypothetical protein